MTIQNERLVMAGRRLGKHQRRVDPRTLNLASYDRGIPAPPPSVTLSRKVPEWPVYLNNDIGDCAIASPAHQIECWTANAARERSLTNADVLTAYEAVSGYRPDNPRHPVHNDSDVGCNMLDVLHYWRHTGIGRDRITAYVAVDHTDVGRLKQAVWLFGGVYLGLRLPETAHVQIDDNEPWTVVAMIGKGTPDSWGGHAVPIVDYDDDWAVCVTWGALQRMSWEFIQDYADEAYAILSADWVDKANQKNPEGFDFALLQSDLSKFSKV
jgi:hypothetical protein